MSQALPKFSHSPFNHSTLRYETYSYPGNSQSRRVSTRLDQSYGTDSFRRYAFSEVPRPTRQYASAAVPDGFQRRSLRLSPTQQPVFANASFRQSGDYGPAWSHHQTVVKQDKRTVQAQNGDMMLGATQPDEGLSWFSRVRRGAEGLHRPNSYPPLFISMDADMEKQMEEDPPIELIKTQNVKAL